MNESCAEPLEGPVTTPSTAAASPSATQVAQPPAGAPQRRRSLGSIGMVLSAGVSVQFGGALAASLMPRAGALGVVTLRLLAAAVVLLVVCRPRVRGHSRADWATVIVFGLTMAGMNGLFYQSIARIPLGPAVALEVLGPLALSVLASRRAINLVWAGLALAGVMLLSGGGFGSLDVVGVLFALGAGAMWAAYIVFSARTGRRFPQADGLALARVVAAVLFLPLGIAESWTPRPSPSARRWPCSPRSCPTPSNSAPCAACPPPPSPSS